MTIRFYGIKDVYLWLEQNNSVFFLIANQTRQIDDKVIGNKNVIDVKNSEEKNIFKREMTSILFPGISFECQLF